jgi:outer membrane protein assembly factor BamA
VRGCLAIGLGLWPTTVAAQSPDDARSAAPPADRRADAKDPSGWVLLPVVSYSPETSLQLGGYVVRYFRLDRESHRSTLGGVVSGTLKKQVVAELRSSVHFDRGARRLDAHLEVQRYPDRFYGVGNAVRGDVFETYERRFLRLRTSFRQRVAGHFSVGATTDHLGMGLDAADSNGPLSTRDYVGEPGGLSSGLGVAASYDGRDDLAFTTSGGFVEAMLVTYLDVWGSDYGFSRATLDARYFARTADRQALGFRYALDVAGGTAPFYQLPTFGGALSMRGYYYGKYRDGVAHSLEAEYRARVFWRLGGAVFGGVGQVGASPASLRRAPLRPSAGAGLRFDLSGNDGFNLRADAAVSPDGPAFYVAVMEAF